jgi:signal transduction histidine kinase
MHKLKLLLLLVLCLHTFVGVLSAHNITDSLNKVLLTQVPDTSKMELYKLLSKEIRNTYPYKALDFAQKGLDIAQKIQSYPHIAVFLTQKGTIYHLQGNYSMALHYFFYALSVSEKHHLLNSKAEIENCVALVYQKQRNFEQALDFAQKSLHTFENLRQRKEVALALSTIAMIYLDKKDYNKSIYYFNKALPILKAGNELRELADTRINLLNVYMEMGNYVKALHLCDIAYQNYKALDWKQGEALALHNYGEIYGGLREIDKSLSYFLQAAAIYHDLEDNMNKAVVLRDIANLHFENKDITDAELYAMKALQAAKSMDIRQEIKENYELLYKIYKAKGLLIKALYYYELERQITDSIYNHEKDNLLLQMHHNYEKEKHLEELALNKAYQKKQAEEIAKQMSIRNMFVGCFVFMALLGFFLWRNNKQKKAINRALQAKQAYIVSQNENLQQVYTELAEQKNKTSKVNEILEQKIAERTEELTATVAKLTAQNQDLAEFSHIVSHNLRSPISTIKGLINLYQVDDYQEKPERLEQLLQHLNKSINKLDTIVYDLNGILTVKESISQTYELIDFQSLTWEVLHGRLTNEISKPNIKIETEFTEGLYFLSIRGYVENIVYQLVSNAIKYQDPEKMLEIKLSTFESANDEVVFSVKDNGLGIPDISKLFKLYQRQHFHIEGTGLGLYLVAVQAQALGGNIEARSEKGQGAEFLVYFKRS